MTEDVKAFEFCDGAAAHATSSTDSAASQSPPPLVVSLPAGLRSKRKLLAQYAGQLSLPDYFGWNWDALDECLRDLSWLEANRPVIIAHAGLPFHGHRHTRQTYLELLQGAVQFWVSGPQPHRLRVIFPSRAESTIHRMISTSG